MPRRSCSRLLTNVLLASALALAACSDPAAAPTNTPADPATVARANLTAAAAGTWTIRAAMPQPRTRLAAATLDGAGTRFYALGGITPNGAITTTVNAYNPTTNSWSTAAPLPTRVYRTNGAAAIGGRIYLSGGLTIRRLVESALRIYDPATNSWSTGASLPQGSFDGVTAAIGTQLYVVASCGAGADCDVSFDRALYRYTPSTNSWVQLASPPHPHRDAAAGVIAGKLYVAGDNGAGGQTLDVYTPATNSWVSRAPLPRARWSAAGVAINGKLYIIGGFAGAPGTTAAVATTSVYDPATNSWTHVAPLPSARTGNAAARLGTGTAARIELVGAGPGNNHLEFRP
jgi:N-acetylneuraminic acid mutarotase